MPLLMPLIRLLLLGILALTVAWHPHAHADLIYLKNGRVLRGEVVKMDDQTVVVVVPAGKITLPRHQVDYVERQSKAEYQVDQADSYLRMRRFDRAIWVLEKAREGNPHSAKVKEKLVQAYEAWAKELVKQRRLTAAEETFAKLKALAPDSDAIIGADAEIGQLKAQLNTILERGQGFARAGRVNEAIETLEQALAFSPEAREQAGATLADAYARRAQALYQATQNLKAHADLERAFELDPGLGERLEDLYVANALQYFHGLYSKGEVEAARNFLTGALRYAPSHKVLLFVAGQVEENEGRFREAANLYGKALGKYLPTANDKSVPPFRESLRKKLGLEEGQIAIRVEPEAEQVFTEAKKGDFELLETEHFLIYHYNLNLAQKIGQALEFHLLEIPRQLQLESKFGELKPTVYIHRNQDEYFAATKQPAWTGGVSRSIYLGNRIRQMEIHSWQTSPRLTKSVLPHELTHLILNSNLIGRQDFPRALHEGYAVLSEPGYRHAHYRSLLKRQLKSNMYIPLADLLVMEQYPTDPDIFYAEGYSFTRYLIDQAGLKALQELLKPGDVRDHIKNVLRKPSLEDIEKDWVLWMERSWKE
jgi:tetratricopeptide (TPR) repeat protein